MAHQASRQNQRVGEAGPDDLQEDCRVYPGSNCEGLVLTAPTR